MTELAENAQNALFLGGKMVFVTFLSRCRHILVHPMPAKLNDGILRNIRFDISRKVRRNFRPYVGTQNPEYCVVEFCWRLIDGAPKTPRTTVTKPSQNRNETVTKP